MAAFSQKKQFDGFEIIDDSSAKFKDQQLLQSQVRGLLNSQAIRIEEKGYLLQLMHDQEMRDSFTDILGEIN